jgi:DNA polymerase-3 subunit delta
MKLKTRDIPGFLNAPYDTVRCCLIYGPEAGLVHDRANKLTDSMGGDPDDPFAGARIDPDTLATDPARLTDEAGAISFGCDLRFIRVDGADKNITTAVENFLNSDPDDSCFVLITAGGLGPRDGLRKLCETADNAAALPCYVEDARDLSRFIRSLLEGHGYTPDRDAVQYLSLHLQGSRMIARRECEKLITYMGDSQFIRLSDVKAILSDFEEGQFDELTDAVASGQDQHCLQALDKLTAQGISEIGLLRATQNYYKRLHLARSHMTERNQSADQAMKNLHPPVFFKKKDLFKRHLRSWSLPRIHYALDRLAVTESACKQTGTLTRPMVERTFLALSKLGK